jgi:DNA adenine methylase Dam
MYVEPPFLYTGSKYKLLSQILPEFDYSKKYFVDLFCGGGSVFANVLDKYDKILANDIIADLIGIHKELFNNSDQIVNEVKLLASCKDDQEKYNKLRNSYNNEPSSVKLWALMMCCNSNMLRFNQKGKFNQTWGQRQFNSSIEQKINIYIEHISNYKNKVIFTSSHFNKLKIKQPSMIYVDPNYGYIDNNGEIGKKQISEAGYSGNWKKEDDISLYNFLINANKNNHSFVLSGLLEHNENKSWLLSKLILDGFNYKKIDFNYNKISKKGNKNSIEIIIKNF